jgi:hypothetical protein
MGKGKKSAHGAICLSSERRVCKGHDTKPATGVAFVARSHCGTTDTISRIWALLISTRDSILVSDIEGSMC